MVSVIFWIIILFILLLIANYTSGKILLTPQFGFIACFIPQAIYALFYVDKWDLELSFNTFVVLILGCSSFLLVSMLMTRLPGGKIKTRVRTESTEANVNMQVPEDLSVYTRNNEIWANGSNPNGSLRAELNNLPNLAIF